MRYRLHHEQWPVMPHDRYHREGWNAALESLEDELRNHYAKGQLVSREDVIRLLRLLMDEPKPF